jgi:hypothetical protein
MKDVPPDKGYYIAGFVDGEGSFYLSARKRKDYSSGWKFSAHFSLGNRDVSVLHICKKHLGCGTIRESRPGFFVLEVEDREKLQSFVVPFFRRFQFLSNKKKAEFRIFQDALSLLEQGTNTPERLERFLELRGKLNQQRNQRAKNLDSLISESFQSKERKDSKKDSKKDSREDSREESSETNTLNDTIY